MIYLHNFAKNEMNDAHMDGGFVRLASTVTVLDVAVSSTIT
jgi:hypothetical protein